MLRIIIGLILASDQRASAFFNDIRVSAMLNAFRRTKRSAVEALALVGGHVDEELLKNDEYLAAVRRRSSSYGRMNEVSRSKIAGRIKFSDAERIRLATLGHELGRKALEGVAAIVSAVALRAMAG